MCLYIYLERKGISLFRINITFQHQSQNYFENVQKEKIPQLLYKSIARRIHLLVYKSAELYPNKAHWKLRKQLSSGGDFRLFRQQTKSQIFFCNKNVWLIFEYMCERRTKGLKRRMGFNEKLEILLPINFCLKGIWFFFVCICIVFVVP